ncbi:MAG: hypothetical protein GF329_06625 [Candidatus Lokiarchaeota archaeon]|nr:hypothetical protein [Candidatus Lokiarchaeota archaeon]
MYGLIKTGLIGSIFLILGDAIQFVRVMFIFLNFPTSPYVGPLYILSNLLILAHYILLGLGLLGIFRTYHYVKGHESMIVMGIYFLSIIPLGVFFFGFYGFGFLYYSYFSFLLKILYSIYDCIIIVTGILLLVLKFNIKSKMIPAILLISAGAFIFWHNLGIFPLSLILKESTYDLVIKIGSLVRSSGLFIAFLKFNQNAI